MKDVCMYRADIFAMPNCERCNRHKYSLMEKNNAELWYFLLFLLIFHFAKNVGFWDPKSFGGNSHFCGLHLG
jgi:hypothetical protein